MVVDFYEQVGYLPDAIINYLALLGWSLDDKTEDFVAAELIEQFLAGAGRQVGGQFRSEEALVVPGPAHAAAAAGRESRPGRALPAAGRAVPAPPRRSFTSSRWST